MAQLGKKRETFRGSRYAKKALHNSLLFRRQRPVLVQCSGWLGLAKTV